MPSRYWTCPCGTRNERVKQKCANEECSRRRPKKRVPVHARTLRDNTYEDYAVVNTVVHGRAFGGEWDGHCCGVCGKPPSQDRRHDRDHGHRRGSVDYGRMRGLACPGDLGCNVLMLPWVTAATAAGIAEAKYVAGESDAERWELIAAYLERVEAHYAGVER